VELGAEFIQGRIPALFELAEQAGLPIVELGGVRMRWTAGQLSPLDARSLRSADIPLELSELDGEDDLSLDAFLARRFPDAARTSARAWVEAYDAADPARVSVRFLERERRAEQRIDGERAFRLVTGYDGVPRTLQAHLRPEQASLQLESIATSIQWRPGEVTVAARAPAGAPLGPFHARRLIVALPLGVLQAPAGEAGAVRFSPALAHREAALPRLAMGHVIKLLFAFKERFWQSALDDELGFLIADEQPFRGWWTGYPVYAPVLVAWAAGPPSDRLAGLTSEQRADRALASLARLLGISRGRVDEQLVTWSTHDWTTDPFARGAYSYVCVGGMRAQEILARPVEDTLFFAGEATELSGNQATVHGALYTGVRAADEALHSLR
jgi:monoamine oxidase